jgi:hypothetical protein
LDPVADDCVFVSVIGTYCIDVVEVLVDEVLDVDVIDVEDPLL